MKKTNPKIDNEPESHKNQLPKKQLKHTWNPFTKDKAFLDTSNRNNATKTETSVAKTPTIIKILKLAIVQ